MIKLISQFPDLKNRLTYGFHVSKTDETIIYFIPKEKEIDTVSYELNGWKRDYCSSFRIEFTYD